MNLTNLNDDRCSWKTVRPFLSHKGSYTSKINLVYKNEMISDDCLHEKINQCLTMFNQCIKYCSYWLNIG